MKQYYEPRIEIIYTQDVVTGFPETGFIPFGNMIQPINFKYMEPANKDSYEDVP